MSKIIIGTEAANGKNFALPSDVVTSTLVVYGGKGMGKTNLGSVLVEELSKVGLRWAAADPLGVWWGLRHNREGKGPGIECVILGGAHGDMPIEPTGGAVVADLVVDEPGNVIIDFSRKPSGEMWGVGEKVRFLTEYARRLFQRQGELVAGRRREPIFQLLDEAARYIPQIIPAGNPDLAKCVGAWETLVEEGRNIGVGVGLMTQRSARMNKSVSEVADAMFSFRIVGPNSIAAVMDWLGEHVPKERIKQHIETLRSLDRGRCLLVSPGWLRFEGEIDIRERDTFDSSATPKPGERAKRVSGEAAKPDLAKYSERMKDTIERAKSEDPKELRKTIQQLKAEIAKSAKAQPHQAVARTQQSVDPRAVQLAVTSATKPLLKQIETLQRHSKIAGDLLTKAIMQFKAITLIEAPKVQGNVSPELIEKLTRHVAGTPVANYPPFIERAKPEPKSTRTSTMESNGVTATQQNILNQLAELDALGIKTPERSQLSLMAGYTNSRSGGFSEPLGSLIQAGLIAAPVPGRVKLTEEGRAKALPVDTPLSTSELHERLCRKLGGAEEKLLREIIAVYPDYISKEDLGARLGYTNVRSGGFSEPVGRLRSLGIVDYPLSGQVKAADWLFLEGAA